MGAAVWGLLERLSCVRLAWHEAEAPRADPAHARRQASRLPNASACTIGAVCFEFFGSMALVGSELERVPMAVAFTLGPGSDSALAPRMLARSTTYERLCC